MDFLTSPSTPGMADQNFDTPSRPLEKLASIKMSDPGGGRISDFSYLPFPSTPRFPDQNFDKPSRALEKLAAIKNSDPTFPASA